MTEDKERERIIAEVLSARTVEEMKRAHALVRQWLQQHPHDTAVRSAAEQLATMWMLHEMRRREA